MARLTAPAARVLACHGAELAAVTATSALSLGLRVAFLRRVTGRR